MSRSTPSSIYVYESCYKNEINKLVSHNIDLDINYAYHAFQMTKKMANKRNIYFVILGNQELEIDYFKRGRS